MLVKDFCAYLDSAVPLDFQQSYDNSGLQIGFSDSEIHAALIVVDVTENVVAEAKEKGCDMIVSHHPLLFGGIKNVSDKTSTGRIIRETVRNNIAVYSAHTNLDAMEGGVSWRMAEKMGLNNIKVLSPLKGKLLKLVVYVPENYIDNVSAAVFDMGAGCIGKYDKSGFRTVGTGSFRAGEGTKPFIGKQGEMCCAKEVRFETVLYSCDKERVIAALLKAHPYQEVAYDLYSLENDNINIGMGCIGTLKHGMDPTSFLEFVADVFDAGGIRYSEMHASEIKKVALCGGSGTSLIPDAVALGADAFITADIKYHTFGEWSGRLLLADIGHFESEKFSVEIIFDLIRKKFPNFALQFSDSNTNPVNYF